MKTVGKAILVVLVVAASVFGQNIVYDNGSDPGDIHPYPVTYGEVVTNSFTVALPTVAESAIVSIYAVNDFNTPQTVRWTITTGPLGGTVVATGESPLDIRMIPWVNSFRFWQWTMQFTLEHTHLQPGTYWLQLEDLHTKFGTWAFWGANDGPSRAYTVDKRFEGNNRARPIASESFQITGTQQH